MSRVLTTTATGTVARKAAGTLLALSTLVTGASGLATAAVVLTPAVAHADSAVGGQITRSEVITRAKFWVAAAPAYSQQGYLADPQGRKYRTDCSGFVSMALHLSSSLTSGSLPGAGSAIGRSSLKAGDYLTGPGHALLFENWTDTSGGFNYYSFGGGSSGVEPPQHLHANINDASIDSHANGFYTAYRYRDIVDDPTTGKGYSLDGSGRADLVYDQPAANPQNDAPGTLRAWHNDGGFAAAPYGTSLAVGAGFTDPTRVRFADLDGKGRVDLIYIQPAGNPQNDPEGTIRAWHNDGGFAAGPFGASVVIGTGFMDPTRVQFADLDGKGRADLVYVQPAANPQNDADGTLRAWHNDGGFAAGPFGTSVVIGTGFTDPTRVRFADLDGKGRADLVYDQPAVNPLNDAEGTLRAWHNDGGFAAAPFGTSLVIGTGFMDPTRVQFADLDGDRKADLVYDQPAVNPQNDADGTLRAWHNDGGFAASPFGTSVVIGTGFTDPTRVRFA